VGTRAGGLLKVRRALVVNLDSAELGDTTPQSLALAADGSIWTSHVDGFRRHRDSHPVEVVPAPGVVPESLVSDPHDGGLWAATTTSLWNWRPGSPGSTGENVELPYDDPLGIAIEPDGSLWVSWRSGGVTHLQHTGDGSGLRPNATRLDASGGLCPGPYTTMTLRKPGGLWMGGPGGISLLDEAGRGRCFAQKQGLRNPNVTSLWVDDDGTLWAGTTPNSGVVRIREGRVVTFDESDGLLCDSIQHVVGDTHDQLWIGCPAQLFRVSKSELEQIANRTIESVHGLAFGLTDGLTSAGTRAGTGRGLVIDRDDRVWVLTPGGVSRINALSSVLSIPASPPWLTSVQVSGADLPIATDSEMVAPLGNGGLAIAYSAARLSLPGRTRFRYSLQPYENEWHESAELAVAYKNLSAGRYNFRVSASNGFGTWSTPVSMALRLLPPFYSSRWFIGLAGLILAGALSGFISLRIRRIKLAVAALQQERDRIARDLHDGVAQGFTSMGLHLDTIQRQLLSDPRAAQGTAAQMHALLAQWHSGVRQMIWTLRKNERPHVAFSVAVRDAVRNARLAVGRDGVQISTDIGVPDGEMKGGALVLHEVPFIIQEAVANSLKHAEARNIKVSVQSFDDEWIAVVEDDGKGMPTDLNIESLAEAGHFGLIGMHERARRIGGTLSIERAADGGVRIMHCIPIVQTEENLP
jgi:signal transduction histidine kinase